MEPVTEDPLRTWRQLLPILANETGHCVEIYKVQGREVIIDDRADPQIEEMQLVAKAGYARDLEEADSTCLCFVSLCS